MMSYEEMAKNVLEAHEEYIRKKKTRRIIVLKCAAVAACVMISFAAVLSVRHHDNDLPKNQFSADDQNITAENDPTEAITKKYIVTTMSSDDKTKEVIVSNSALNTTESVQPLVSGDFTTLVSSNQETASVPEYSQIIQTLPPLPVTGQNDYKPLEKPVTEEKITTPAVKPQEPVTVGTTSIQIPVTDPVTDTPSEQSPSENKQEHVTDNHIYLHWNDMTINQQYFMAEFGEPLTFYSTLEKEISAGEVGEYICKAYMSGYDWYELIYYHCEAEAYRIKGDNEGKTIAVKFSGDDKYYIYSTGDEGDAEVDG